MPLLNVIIPILFSLVPVFQTDALAFGSSEVDVLSDASVAGVEEIIEPQVERVYQTRSVGVEVTAPSSIVLDSVSGTVLWSEDEDTKRSIASLTKLITAAVLFAEPRDMDDVLTLTGADLRPEGGNRHIYLGEQITVEEALHAMLIASDNEATVALVRHFGYTEETFQQAVQSWLETHYLYATTIIEPTGLHALNVSTAREIALITELVFQNPRLADIAEKSSFSFVTQNTGRTIKLNSTNILLDSDYRIRMGKTGYTDEAGGCFVTRAQTPEGHEVISVVLGSASRSERFLDTKAILYWVYENYRWNY
ncbi:MAG: D-alanyl-D-alanine carboxypeptidase family protein [Patescibacteria group bacterium]